MIKVYTGGVYDILHKGHLRLLKRAKSLGDYLIVGIQEDTSVMKTKPRPILSTQERVEQMQELPFVNEVVNYHTTLDHLSWLKPDIFVHGDDWHAQTDRAEDIEILLALGVHIVFLPRTTDISTSEIKRRICAVK